MINGFAFVFVLKFAALFFFFFSSRRRHTRCLSDWSSDVCSSDLFMKRLIECVPNFSEGRDTSKVDALVDAMRGVPGLLVLDRESDADHNRSVVTLAGEPERSEERRVGKECRSRWSPYH